MSATAPPLDPEAAAEQDVIDPSTTNNNNNNNASTQPPSSSSLDDDIQDDDTGTTPQEQNYAQSLAEDAQFTVNTASIIIVVVSCLHFAYLLYYYGWVWFNLSFKHEYTQAFSPPAPGPLIDERYNFQWMIIATMGFHMIPPCAAIWLLIAPTNTARKDIYRFVSAIAVLVAVGVGLWDFLYVWIFQNNSTFYPFSVANEVNFCCKYWGAVFAAHGCHNFNDCTDLPTIPTISLHTNPFFVKHLWACGFTAAFGIVHIFLSGMHTYYTARFDDMVAENEGLAPGQQQGSYPSSGPFSFYQTRPNQYTKGGRIALHVFNAIYLVMAVCFVVFLVLPLTVRYSHEWPPTGPIGIQDGRQGIQVVGVVMSCSVILIPFLVLLGMWAQGNYPGLVTVLVCFMLVSATHVFSFMIMIGTRANGNKPGYPNNLANHPLRCCAPDVYSDPASQCDNAGACVLPFDGYPQWTTLPTNSAEIPYNPTYTGMFVMMVFFLILDFILAVLLFVTFLGRAVLKNVNDTFATNIGAFFDVIDNWIDAPLRNLAAKAKKTDTPMFPYQQQQQHFSAASSSSSNNNTKKSVSRNVAMPLGSKKIAAAAPTTTPVANTTSRRRKKQEAQASLSAIPSSSSAIAVKKVDVHVPGSSSGGGGGSRGNNKED